MAAPGSVGTPAPTPAKPEDLITAWYEGTGAYEGLTFFEWIAGSGSSYKVTGLIFPGMPPIEAGDFAGAATGRPVDPPASPAATTAPGRALPEPVSWGDAVHVQGWEICTPINEVFPSPDPTESRGCAAPRSTARSSSTIRGSAGPRRARTLATRGARSRRRGGVWSPEQRIENPEAPGWNDERRLHSPTGEMISAWFEGTGAYEGLSFFEWIGVPGGADPSGYAVTGLIFPGKPPVPKP